MAKIQFDKYYTPPIVAKWCINKAYEVIGKDNISEIIEPSAGGGSFSHQIEGCKAYDLYPQHEYIEQADFLDMELKYKKGRLFIGNPPFGAGQKTILRGFYNKCVKEGDYIAWILSANHYDNYNNGFNKFEIIHSSMIDTHYTNQELKTAFVIYKRHEYQDVFENQKYESNVFEMTSYARNKPGTDQQKIKDYDYAFIQWGDLLRPSKPYEKVRVVGVKIKDEKWREPIITYLRWLYDYNRETGILNERCISGGSITDLTPIKRLIWLQFPEIFHTPSPTI